MSLGIKPPPKSEITGSGTDPENIRWTDSAEITGSDIDSEYIRLVNSATSQSWIPPLGDSLTPVDTSGDARFPFENFFMIQPSKLGGLGAFAVRDLKKHETVLLENPLLTTNHFHLIRDFFNLSHAAKAAYLSLHDGEGGDPFSKIERIMKRNSFKVPGGVGIFPIASRFNHACPSVRNVQYEFDSDRGLLSFTVCEDVIPAGTELLINYGHTPARLYEIYGFRCVCGGCVPLTDEDIADFYRW
ncbi:hypothetical protein VTK56DRAFT_1862 [Thermocarpiscus australiensis]